MTGSVVTVDGGHLVSGLCSERSLLRHESPVSRSSAIFSTCASAVSNSTSARALQPRLERRDDLDLAQPLHRDDEGDAEAGLVGLVQRGEADALVAGQPVEPGRGLLVGRFRRQLARGGELAGEIGMAAQQGASSARGWRRA